MIYAGSPNEQFPYIAAALAHDLRAGARCVYLNSPDLVFGFRAYLAHAGIDADSAIRKGSLILSSERSHLVNGRFNPWLMLDSLSALATQSEREGFPKLVVTGDMTWEFANRNNFSELIAYERALERLFEELPLLHGICQYHQDTLPTSALRDALCTHQSVYINQTLFRLNPYFDPESDANGTNHIPTEISDLIARFHQHQ